MTNVHFTCTYVHKPYLVKVPLNGEEVRKTRKFIHVVYDCPLMCIAYRTGITILIS